MQRAKLIGFLVLIIAVAAFFAVRRSGNKSAGPSTDAAAANPPVPVSVATAVEGTMSKTVPVIGQLQSDNNVSLTSKVAGKLVAFYVTTGDQVSPGQLVAELDSSDARTALQLAQAGLDSAIVKYNQARSGVNMKDVATQTAIQVARTNLASARTKLQQTITNAQIEDTQADTGVQQARDSLASAQQNLQQMQTGARQQERAQSVLAVARAQADYDQAKDTFDRQDNLYKAGAISQQQRTDAMYQLQVAATALDTAKQAASLVQEGNRSEQVAMAQAQVGQAQAAYRAAQAQIAKKAANRDDIRAAQDLVRQYQAQLASAEAGSAQYTLTRQDVQAAAAAVEQARAQVAQARDQLVNTRIYSPVGGVVATRPATIGGSVTPTTVLMTIAPTRGLYFEANVPEDAIASVHVGDPVTTTVDALPGRTFEGRISEIIPVAESATKLYRVHISVPNSGGVLPSNGFARGQITVSQVKGIIIPQDAISSAVGDYYIYIIKDNQAHRRNIKLGLTDDVHAQVISGLNPGEQYVTAGKDSLTDGVTVSVQPDMRNGAVSGASPAVTL